MTTPRVIINSCTRFVDKSLPPLLSSLRDAGVPSSSIIVVVGESPRAESSTNPDGVRFINVRYANIDNNSFLWVSRDSTDEDIDDSSWFVNLHDTCIVEKDFWQKVLLHVENLDPMVRVLAASLRTFPSMSMGLLRTSAVRSSGVRDDLSKLVNYSCDREKLMSIKQNLHMLEDYVFKILQRSGDVIALHGEPEWGKTMEYSLQGGSTRHIETHPGLGVIKYKANNTQGWYLDL